MTIRRRLSISFLSGLTILLFAAPAISDRDKKKDRDSYEKAGDATEGAVKKAGDAAESGLDATGKGVGEAVEHGSRGAAVGAKKTAKAAAAAGEAVAGFFTRGDDGDPVAQIRAAQRELRSRGYYGGAIDGIVGPLTRSALRKFQGDHNLKVTGSLDEATQKKLGID